MVSVPAPIGYAYASAPCISLQCAHIFLSHPSEPQCSYDPVDGVVLAPDTDPVEKIRQLEDQICKFAIALTMRPFILLNPAQLKSQLFDQHHLTSRSVSPHLIPSSSRVSPSTTGIALPQSISIMSLASPDAHMRSESGSPELRTGKSKAPDPFMDLLFLGWNPDLPDPQTLNH